MDGTWARLPSIIGATTSSALKQGWRESLTPFSSRIGISRNQWLADAIINAMKNLQSVIKNGPGNFKREEMDILRQMDVILQCDKKQALKHDTFTAGTVQVKPAMHDRVVHPRVENTALRPRVDDALPRGITVAAVDKLYRPPHPMTTRSRVAAQKLALAMHIRPPTQISCGSDFEAAMNVMESNLR